MFALLLLAHLLGDFVFQSNRMIADKAAGWRGHARHVCYHALILVLCCIPLWRPRLCALLLLLTLGLNCGVHFLQDRAKQRLSVGVRSAPARVGLFLADQFLHAAVLAILSLTVLSQQALNTPTLYLANLLAGSPQTAHEVNHVLANSATILSAMIAAAWGGWALLLQILPAGSTTAPWAHGKQAVLAACERVMLALLIAFAAVYVAGIVLLADLLIRLLLLPRSENGRSRAGLTVAHVLVALACGVGLKAAMQAG